MSFHAPNTAFAPHTPLVLHQQAISGERRYTAYSDASWLDEIIAGVPGLPDRFHDHGMVLVEQGDKLKEIPRSFWARGHRRFRLRLKPVDGKPVRIIAYDLPGRSGGGGQGGKSLMTIVATVALLAVGTFITGGGLLGALGPGTLAAGSWGAQALAAGVTFLGRLALTFAAKPAAQAQGETANNAAPALGQAGASGNTVAAGSPLYYVAGRAKVFPHMATFPIVELDGNDEFVEACYILAGPHELKNPKAEGTLLSEIPGLTWAMDDGTSPAPTRLLTRYGSMSQPQKELKGLRRSKANPHVLEDQMVPERSLPEAHVVTSKPDPDEIWLQYLWPTNFGNANGDTEVVMPLRLKLRVAGTSTWINLPELMFHSKSTGSISKKVVIKWAASAPVVSDQAFQNGAWHSFHTVPDQNAGGDVKPGWSAHASFVGGASYNATARVERRADGFIIYLDPTVFPRGATWDIWMMRGTLSRVQAWANQAGPFDPAGYRYGSTVWSLFHSWLTGGFHYTLNVANWLSISVVETMILMRVTSVWNRPPLPQPGHAVLELKGRNINAALVSVEAAALVKVWNGTGFEGLAPSENPADHYFHTLTGPLTSSPIPTRWVNVPELGAWHGANVAAGRKVSLVLEGREWRDTLDALAAAGLARRLEGRLFSVARQRNTLAEAVAPTIVFNHLTAANVAWQKLFDPVPDALLVSFRNADQDWEQDEVLVLRPGVPSRLQARRVLTLQADGLTDRDQIIEFYRLYMAAAWHRDVTYTFDSWVEGFAAREGDIIGLNHTTLSDQHTAAEIIQITRNGANEIVSLTLGATRAANAPDGIEALADLAAVEDLAAQGVKLGLAIQTGAGVVTQPVEDLAVDSATVSFEVPFVNDDVRVGQVAIMGQRSLEYSRFEVTGIQPAVSGATNRFTYTCVHETPDMWEGI